MTRKLVTVVLVSGVSFAVYLVVGGTAAQQTDFLADAGYTAPNRVATCPVRISTECLNEAADAGLSVHRYERLRFPVVLTVLPDGGRDVQLPPMRPSARDCIEVMDWGDCLLDTVATFPAVASKWGQPLPFGLGAVRRCVRPARPGLQCMRLYPDAGLWDFGDRNVFPRIEASNPADCESVECSIVFGDSPEGDL